RLPGGLLVLGTVAFEFVRIRRADGEEAGELELCVPGDELGLPLEDRRLGAAVTCADPKPSPVALLLVRGETGRVAVDAAMRTGGRYRLVVNRERSDATGVKQERFQPGWSDLQAGPFGNPV